MWESGTVARHIILLVVTFFSITGRALPQDRHQLDLFTGIARAGGELEFAGRHCFVDFARTPLTDESLGHLHGILKQLPEITYLDLENTEITDSGLEALAVLSNLAAVDVTGTPVTDEGTINFIRLSLSENVQVVDNSPPNSTPFPGWKNIRPRIWRGNYPDCDLRFSSSGNQLAMATGNGVYVLATRDAAIRDLLTEGRFAEFSEDEQYIAIANTDGTRVLKLDGLEQIQHFPLRTQSPSRAAFSSDRRSLTVDEYNVAFKYELETGELLERFTERLAGRSVAGTHRFSSTVSNLVSPDGENISGKLNEQVSDIGMGVISGNGRFAAWVQDRYRHGAPSSAIHIANLKSGEVIKRLWTPDCDWNTGDFSADGGRIIVGAIQGMVVVFDVETERLLFSHQSTAGAAKCVAISPDGNWVAAAFGHHSLRWWRIDDRADDVQFANPLRRKIRASPEVESIFATFVDSVQQMDPAKTEIVQQWRSNLRDSSSEVQLVQLALRHADPEIRLAILKTLAIPASKEYGKVLLSDGVKSQLLNVVDNFTEELSVRREAVRTLLQSHESDRKQLYERLSVLNSNAFFAVPTLAEFVSDRENRHWMVAGAFDAPKGAVNLLGSWGTDGSEAVPALILVLDEHPNRGDFAAEAARALGAMGKEAEQALPALQRAANSSHSTVRLAAERAFRMIRSGVR